MKLSKSAITRALEEANTHARVNLAVLGKTAMDRSVVVGPIATVLNTNAPEPLEDDVVHPFLIALEHARGSETLAPGSLKACLTYAERLNRRALRTPHEVVGRTFTRADVPRIVSGVLDENDVAVLTNFVQEAGASRYIVERAPSRFDSVEFVDSYEFKHASKNVDGTVVMDNARVLIADGYVETVAEIHNVLDRCGRDSERLLICARGFSDDVLHTLAVNRGRGTLIAYALTFPFDDNDANTLVDLATIVGGDVVSSLKGQLFTTVDVSTLPRALYARLRGQTLDLRGDGSRARVASVLLSVQSKAAAAEEPVRSILERRVRRLSGACMTVRLYNTIDHSVRVEAWDLALRSLQASVKGVADVDDQEAWPNRDVVPLVSIATAHEIAGRLVKALNNLDSYV